MIMMSKRVKKESKEARKQTKQVNMVEVKSAFPLINENKTS